MMMIKDAVKVQVTLVLRLNDFVTNRAISAGRGLRVESADGYMRPVVKSGGFFIFTGRRPDGIRVTSDYYENACLDTRSHAGTVLRLFLIPRSVGKNSPCLSAEGETHIGFGGNGAGYAIAETLTGGSTKIRLHKDDLRDITDMFHAIVPPDGGAEVLYITKNNGNGLYTLKDASPREYPTRGTRLVPLCRVTGGTIPVPPGVNTAYILSGDRMQILEVSL